MPLTLRTVRFLAVALSLWFATARADEAATAAGPAGDVAAAAAAKPTPALPKLRDPLKPMNVAFYHFNDKLYFWVLKPAAQGYSWVVPETGRVWVRNFFTNVAMPGRCVNATLQGRFKVAGCELERFGINTTLGIFGFDDFAARRWSIKAPKGEDTGLTLGHYGVKPAIYIHWPLFGPSNPRDTVGLVADSFLDPATWLLEFPARIGAKAVDRVNRTSLSLGDYEDLKESALDPYVAVRNAYHQYREKRILGADKPGDKPAAKP